MSTPAEVAKRMEQRADRLGDLSKPLAISAAKLNAQISQAFTDQKSPAGDAWIKTKTGEPFRIAGVRIVSDAHSLKLLGPAFLRAHMRGGEKDGKPGHPPKRNPTPFEPRGDGWALIPAALQAVSREILSYVVKG